MSSAVRSAKRKHDSDDGDIDGNNCVAKTQRVDVPLPEVQANSSHPQPMNKVLPAVITFPPRVPGTVRLATWNICGIAASQKKASADARRPACHAALPYAALGFQTLHRSGGPRRPCSHRDKGHYPSIPYAPEFVLFGLRWRFRGVAI
jgi:hypothetical protein